MSMTLYELIDVPKSATEDTIKQALTQKQRFWSRRASNAPSLDARQEAERKMTELTEARKVLLDPQQRAVYDAQIGGGGGPVRQPSPAPVSPIWNPSPVRPTPDEPSPGPLPPIWPRPNPTPQPLSLLSFWGRVSAYRQRVRKNWRFRLGILFVIFGLLSFIPTANASASVGAAIFWLALGVGLLYWHRKRKRAGG